MKTVTRILVAGAWCVLGSYCPARTSASFLTPSKFVLRNGWAIQSSAKVLQHGAVISTTQFEPSGWYPAEVPATVLAVLVQDKVYRRPYIGMNLRQIPGSEYLASWALAGNHYPPGYEFFQ